MLSVKGVFKKKFQEKLDSVKGVDGDADDKAVVRDISTRATSNVESAETRVFSVYTMKEKVLDDYLYRIRLMRPEYVVRSVTSQYKLIALIYMLSFFTFMGGMYVVWQKNLNVDVVYQRIDGVSMKLPNDPRSRVLLTKVIQDAKISNPGAIYRLEEKGDKNEE